MCLRYFEKEAAEVPDGTFSLLPSLLGLRILAHLPASLQHQERERPLGTVSTCGLQVSSGASRRGEGGESGGGARRTPRNVQLAPLTAGQAAWLLRPAGRQGGPELLQLSPERHQCRLPLRMGERKI